MSYLIAVVIYTAMLALGLAVYWVVAEIQDRLHARRTVAAFDRFVASMESRRAADRSE